MSSSEEMDTVRPSNKRRLLECRSRDLILLSVTQLFLSYIPVYGVSGNMTIY